MSSVGLILGIIVAVFGLRMIIMALQAIFTGRVLVRRGRSSHWEDAPSTGDAMKAAFSKMLMGLLLIALGAFLVF